MAECMGYDELVITLRDRFSEVPVSYGLAASGDTVIQTFVSEAGTWTLVAITPERQGCILAIGNAFVFVENPWPNDDIEG